ncbi:MAG: type II toxin-antitoxin system RelE/ParE family toxin [Micrococcaceae bacterium]|nr:type II toxin-antitoxin system RelE/ParE family toxin [Micrococcaceae bacterium]
MSPRRVITTRQADADIKEAVDHYQDQGAPEAALGFVDNLEDTIALLSEHPNLGSTRFAVETNIPEMRALTLQRFPYIAFYTENADTIRIHRVLHTARDIPSRLSDD